MHRGFSRGQIVKGAGGNNGPRAVSRGVWNRTIAVGANLPSEAFRLWQIVALDQILPLRPAKLPNRNGDVGRAHAAGRFAAARAIAVTEAHEWGGYLVAYRFA